MRLWFVMAVVAVGLSLTGCTVGVPLWPLLLQTPSATFTNTCPTPLTLPVADEQVAGR